MKADLRTCRYCPHYVYDWQYMNTNNAGYFMPSINSVPHLCYLACQSVERDAHVDDCSVIAETFHVPHECPMEGEHVYHNARLLGLYRTVGRYFDERAIQ